MNSIRQTNQLHQSSVNQFPVQQQTCSFYSIRNHSSSSPLMQSSSLKNGLSPQSGQSQFISIAYVPPSISEFAVSEELSRVAPEHFAVLVEQCCEIKDHADLQNNQALQKYQKIRIPNQQNTDQPQKSQLSIGKQSSIHEIEVQNLTEQIEIQKDSSNSHLINLQSEDHCESPCQYENYQSSSESSESQSQSESQYQMESESESQSEFQYSSCRKPIPKTRQNSKNTSLSTLKSGKNSRKPLRKKLVESSTEIDNQSSKQIIPSCQNKLQSNPQKQRIHKGKPIKKFKTKGQRKKPNTQNYSVFNSIQNYFN